jgi:hypothetical protein
MKTLCCTIAAATLLIAAPAMAQQIHTTGISTSLWSSAQGTSDSYGSATGFGTSSSGSAITTGQGGTGLGGLLGMTQALTTSVAGASSTGSGYAQAQTSGYAGGSITGFVSRSH